MKFDHNTICKPVALRELLFYKSLTEDLKHFTPKYHGRRVNILTIMKYSHSDLHSCYSIPLNVISSVSSFLISSVVPCQYLIKTFIDYTVTSLG